MTELNSAKTGHYMLRWINSEGETGHWSQTVGATIGARAGAALVPGTPVHPVVV